MYMKIEVGAHNKGYNEKSMYLYCVYWKFLQTRSQIQGALNLIHLVITSDKILPNYRLYGHRELRPTMNPGDKLIEIIKTKSE